MCVLEGVFGEGNFRGGRGGGVRGSHRLVVSLLHCTCSSNSTVLSSQSRYSVSKRSLSSCTRSSPPLASSNWPSSSTTCSCNCSWRRVERIQWKSKK